MCLLCIHGDHSEGVRKLEDIALGESIGRNDYITNYIRTFKLSLSELLVRHTCDPDLPIPVE